jgi:UDP-2-acetamido-2,6-beta-L-arabino-hexul-4-ose reductase
MSGKTVAITGGFGFLGWHVACAFRSEGWNVIRLGREQNWPELAKLATVLVHCAGVNRGSDHEVREGNAEVARKACALVSTTPVETVIYVNSSQAGNGSIYGDAKALAAVALEQECLKTGAVFTNLLVPNVFGEHGVPEYNSFVATFCSAIVSGGSPVLHANRELSLTHASDVADAIVQAASGQARGNTQRIASTVASVHSIASVLSNQHKSYLAGILPDMSERFDRLLFNTLRSFMYPAAYPLPLDPKRDNRGHLVETIKAGSGGQSFVSWTHPEITRGNHYHRRKFERFLVLQGEAEIKLRRLFHDDVITFRVSGDDPSPVDMPVLHTHNITNVGSGELITMFWTNEIFDPENPDTYAEPVEPVEVVAS